MVTSTGNFPALFKTGRYSGKGYILTKVASNAYVLNKPMNLKNDAVDYHQHTLADGRYLVFVGNVTEDYINNVITGTVVGTVNTHRVQSFRGGIHGLRTLLARYGVPHQELAITYDGYPEDLLKPKLWHYVELNTTRWKNVEGGWTMINIPKTDAWPMIKVAIEDLCPYGIMEDDTIMICAISHTYKKKSTVQAQLLATAQQPINNLLAALMKGDKDTAKAWYYQCQKDVFNRTTEECWDWDTHRTVVGSVFDFLRQYIMDASGTLAEALKICCDDTDGL